VSLGVLWLYRLLFVPVLLVMAPRYLWRMRRRGGYRENFAQRFGKVPALPAKRPGVKRLWVQAVSVGEMLAIEPVLQRLKQEGFEVYLSTTTSTGYQLATERYASLVLAIGYFPIDWWLFSVRAWRKVEPDLAIITEGERWPEHLAQASRRGVPLICINARISDRSFYRLKQFPSVARLALADISRLGAGSEQDAKRFRDLGVPPEKIVMTGNLKLDVTIERLSDEDHAALQQEMGLTDGFVILGSSTWPGEEELLITAMRIMRERRHLCQLLLVPRHAERRDEIVRLLEAEGLSYHLRSRGKAPRLVDVSVGDTTGELRKFTQLSHLVFIGKSMPPHTEGQTPVEAAALELPVVFGPGMGNFRTIARELVVRKAAAEVRDPALLPVFIANLLEDQPRRYNMSRSAGKWHRENVGGVDRTLALIRGELANSSR
jgi:3-deoxy-D-manno-octulosonic-acid transferase